MRFGLFDLAQQWRTQLEMESFHRLFFGRFLRKLYHGAGILHRCRWSGYVFLHIIRTGNVDKHHGIYHRPAFER